MIKYKNIPTYTKLCYFVIYLILLIAFYLFLEQFFSKNKYLIEKYSSHKSLPDFFITPRITGGLGNQLFVMASACSYAKDHNIPVISEKITNVSSYGNSRSSYWNSIFHKIKTVDSFEKIKLKDIGENEVGPTSKQRGHDFLRPGEPAVWP